MSHDDPTCPDCGGELRGPFDGFYTCLDCDFYANRSLAGGYVHYETGEKFYFDDDTHSWRVEMIDDAGSLPGCSEWYEVEAVDEDAAVARARAMAEEKFEDSYCVQVDGPYPRGDK